MTIRADAHKPEFHRAAPPQLPVRVATTGTLTIASDLNAGDTVDGVTLAAGDRVLVKDQGTGSQNGIYVAGASPARAFDMEEGVAAYGALIYVVAGTANGGKQFVCTNTTVPTIGVTALTFAEFGGGGSIEVSDGSVSVDPTTLLSFDPDHFEVTDEGSDEALVTLLPHGHDPPTPGIHKILVKRTTDFSSSASNDSVPDYDDVIEDTMTDSWWDAGDPDGFLVTADYDGLDAIFTAKGAMADPGTSTYIECKMYYFPAASGRNRPIHSSTDEDYLIGVEQHPAEDNVNHFIEFVSDPITVGTGDRVFAVWRTSTAQTIITYNGRVSITFGAYIVGSASESGGSSVPPPILLESGHAVPFTFDEILQESDGSDFLWASE